MQTAHIALPANRIVASMPRICRSSSIAAQRDGDVAFSRWQWLISRRSSGAIRGDRATPLLGRKARKREIVLGCRTRVKLNRSSRSVALCTATGQTAGRKSQWICYSWTKFLLPALEQKRKNGTWPFSGHLIDSGIQDWIMEIHR